MNERIRQLAKQAGDYVNEVYTPPVRSNTPGKIWEDGHVDWHTQFNEKFAELIVRECIGIVEKNESEIHYDTGMYPAYPTATVREILEHFGVEE